MRSILSILFVCAFSIQDFSQAPPIQWEKSFGGTLDDVGSSIIQTSDGGFITAGWAQSNNGNVTGNHGGYDCWIVKTDASGNLQWQKTYGGTSNDFAHCIQQTSDGGYIVAASSQSNSGDLTLNHGGYDFWIFKLDSNGNIQWQKSYGGTADEEALSIVQTINGGYIIAGYSASVNGDVTGHHPTGGASYDCWIVKINTVGTIHWAKCYGGSGAYDAAYSILQIASGGFIFTGEANSQDGDVTGLHGTGSVDYWVVRIDTLGNIIWQKCFGGTGPDFSASISKTFDGEYIVAGLAQSTDGDVIGLHGLSGDFWVIKLDTNGIVRWKKTYGGTQEEIAEHIFQTSDSGYVVAGESSSVDGDVTGHHGSISTHDYWIAKLDTGGTLLWEKSLGGTGEDQGYCIQETSDNGFIICGNAASTNGDVTGNHGNNDFWIVKLAAPLGVNENHNVFNVNVYPNPTSGILNISSEEEIKTVIVNDIIGNEIYKSESQVKTIDLSYFPQGIYFLTIKTAKGISVKKIVKS